MRAPLPTKAEIASRLEEIIEDLQQGEIDGAKTKLHMLDFGRLLELAAKSKAKGDAHILTPTELYGLGRLKETASILDALTRAFNVGNKAAALHSAQKALNRWQASR